MIKTALWPVTSMEEAPRVKAKAVVLVDGRAELGRAMMACNFEDWQNGVTVVQPRLKTMSKGKRKARAV